MLRFRGLVQKSFVLRKVRIASSRAAHQRRLRFETLEDRRVLANFMVTNVADATVTGFGQAPGTLRQAIYDANHTGGSDVIQFQPGLQGTIELAVADDNGVGPSALVVSSTITIRGDSSRITIGRSNASDDMRLFRILPSGDLTMESISLTNGSARGSDGIAPGEDGGDARGGAIYNEGVVRIIGSTLYANRAVGGNGGPGANAGVADGGAVFNAQGTLVITNSTMSGNSAVRGTGASSPFSHGGAVYGHNGSITIHNSTITLSDAWVGRGIYVRADQGITNLGLWSTIIGQADVITGIADFQAVFDMGGQLNVVGGNNLIRSQGDYQFITVATDDPLLGPLADNGGPTPTHALAIGSPAINQGVNSTGLSNDQRGVSYARVVGGAVDIGAFELQVVSEPALFGDYNLSQVVDAADYVLWRKTLGASVTTYSGADGNGNGSVDVADYAVWRAHFNENIASAAANTPAAHSSARSLLWSPIELAASGIASRLGPNQRPGRSGTAARRANVLNAVLLDLQRPSKTSQVAHSWPQPAVEAGGSDDDALDGNGIWDSWPCSRSLPILLRIPH